MSISGDFLLISILAIIILAIIILVGTFIYSRAILNRYSKIISRLYRASFRGMDTERKRIAIELHNLLAIHFININKDIELLKNSLTNEHNEKLRQLESNFLKLRNETHNTIECMYPIELVRQDWEGSFKKLAQQITNGDITVNIESFASNFPSNQKLPNAFWVVQEIIINAVKHAHVKRIQISILDEDNVFRITIFYKATPEAKKWIKEKPETFNGMGRKIIKDRLNIIGGTEKILLQDGVLSHQIKITNADTNY